METNNTRNWIIIGVVALILVAGGWWLMQRTKPAGGALSGITGGNASSTGSTSLTSGSSSPTSTAGTVPVSTGAQGEQVTVDDQPAGVIVRITSMNLSRSTWVAVRDERSVMGAAWFAAGEKTGTVELLRGTEAGKTYSVVLYIDNGNHAFDLASDELVTGVGDTFVATGGETSTATTTAH